MTGSYPGIISLSRAQEISWQYLLLRTVILQEKSRWVPPKVACEEGHCEKSHASGTRKKMLEPRTEPALSLDGRTGMESSLLAVKKECDLIKGSHSFGLLAVKV